MESKGNYEYLQDFWNKQSTPLHKHKTEDWFKRYFNEIKLLFECNGKTLLDIGCGSGELLEFQSVDYQSIVGIDYSKSMLDKAEFIRSSKNLKNVKLHCDSTRMISKYKIEGGYDHILLSGILQYLDKQEIKKLFGDLKQMVAANGIVVITNVPDFNLKLMHDVGNFHYAVDQKFDKKNLLKSILRLAYHSFKYRKTNKAKALSMGNWYTRGEMREICMQLGYNVEFYNSLYTPYGYKFHMRMTLA